MKSTKSLNFTGMKLGCLGNMLKCENKIAVKRKLEDARVKLKLARDNRAGINVVAKIDAVADSCEVMVANEAVEVIDDDDLFEEVEDNIDIEESIEV